MFSLADKWTVLIVGALAGGPRRFGELRDAIDGVSEKMLTQTLRSLERDGLVTRTVHPVQPPHVEYRLTRLGATLEEPLAALRGWAERHIGEIERARGESDAPVSRSRPAARRR